MGCGSSSPAHPPGGAAAANNNDDPSRRRPPPPQSSSNHQNGGNDASSSSSAIDGQLERARAEEEGKIKMLLLGAGESGKSTIFKQMRLLYNNANCERSDDELRMYGVIARSNVVVAMRKLCAHLRNLGLEEELDRESGGTGDDDDDLDDGDRGGMTVRQAYDELMAYLVDNTANNNNNNSAAAGSSLSAAATCALPLAPSSAVGPPVDSIATDNNSNNNDINQSISKGGKKDWVGQSPRAGLAANNDARQFLAHHESIKILWQASVVCFLLVGRVFMHMIVVCVCVCVCVCVIVVYISLEKSGLY